MKRLFILTTLLLLLAQSKANLYYRTDFGAKENELSSLKFDSYHGRFNRFEVGTLMTPIIVADEYNNREITMPLIVFINRYQN